MRFLFLLQAYSKQVRGSNVVSFNDLPVTVSPFLLPFLFLILFPAHITLAQQDCILDEKPASSFVVDRANILSPGTEAKLVEILNDFDRRTSNQLLVVTVEDLCGYDRAEFTYTLGEKWGVGGKEFNNGMVLMVKPHGEAGQRHVFIAIGYGLEGAIPDATAKRIVEQVIIPRFRENDFEGGIGAGVETLMGLASGEISKERYAEQDIPVLPLFIVLFIILFIFISAIRRMQRTSIGRDMSFWTALWMLSQMGGRKHGSWGDFHSGGGRFGGGGGFGGFGGGSFGGGGAGGSW